VIFKAIGSPDGAGWPEDKPAWSGTSGANGTGTTKTITFSDTGNFSIAAECGAAISSTISVKTLSVSADKISICAGGIASPVHQTAIAAIWKDAQGNPISNQAVAFSVENSHAAYPATLSAATAVTDNAGKATVTLTSSRKIGATAVVTAAVGTVQGQTIPISMDDATEDWEIDPEEILADGESTAAVKLTLTFDGLPVTGHQVTWRINQIWNADNELVYRADPAFGSAAGYGSVSPTPASTDANGLVETIYSVGMEDGVVEFAALDSTVVANSNRIRTNTSKLKLNAFYVYTYVSGNPTASSAGKQSGTRTRMEFHVTLNALLKRSGTARPTTTTIFFRPKRTGIPTQPLIAGKLPAEPGGGTTSGNYTVWEYWSVNPGWDVTKLRGKWNISIELANKKQKIVQDSYNFKIDKRDQIVKLATDWVGGTNTELDAAAGGTSCGHFTSMIYKQLGLGDIPSGVGPQLGEAKLASTGDGTLLFYGNYDDGVTWDSAHVAIQVGNQRININSNTTRGSPVVSEGVMVGVEGGPAQPNPITRYSADVRHRSTVDLDAD